MSLPVMTIDEIRAQIIADIEAATGQQIPAELISWDNIAALVFAGFFKKLEKSQQKAVLNALIDKTTDLGVLEVFSGWTQTPRLQKNSAALNVGGTGVAGEVIPGGISATTYISADGQKFYFEDDYTIPANGIVDTTVIAMLPGGQGNLYKGNLDITAQNANISSVLVIDATDPIAIEGRDEETLESWRSRIRRAAAQPVLSDNYSYYNETAIQTPGRIVKNAYAYVGRPCEMELFIRDYSDLGIPTSEVIALVDDWFRGVNDGELKLNAGLEGYVPDNATELRFQVKKCTNTDASVRIYGLQPDSEENRSLVIAKLNPWFSGRQPYVKGVSLENEGLVDKNSLITETQAVIDENGLDSFTTIQFSVNAGSFVSIDEYPLGKGELINLNSRIEWLS